MSGQRKKRKRNKIKKVKIVTLINSASMRLTGKKYACLVKECVPGEFVKWGKIFHITEKRNRDHLYLREFTTACSDCKRKIKRWKVINGS